MGVIQGPALGVDRLAKKQIHGGDLALYVPLVILTKKLKFNRKTNRHFKKNCDNKKKENFGKMPRIFGLRSCLEAVQDSIQLFGQNLDEPQEQTQIQRNKHDHHENHMWHVSHTELTLGSFETLDDINIPDEIVDMTIDKDEDVDKENEPPVTLALESLPNNTLVPPIVIKKGENLHYQPESVIKTDDSRTKNSNERTPPTGELPENNK